MSSRGSPDPAFVCALAVFSKGQALAFEARKWSQLGPSREALAWHLVPLASLWLAFGGQLGYKDGIKNQREIAMKIRGENYRKIDPRASKIRSVFEPEKQIPRTRFWDGRPRPPQGLPRASQASLWGVFGVPLDSLWPSLGSYWALFGTPLAPFSIPWHPLGHPMATIGVPALYLRQPKTRSHDK